MHVKDMHVEGAHARCLPFSLHLRDILVVHLFNAGLHWMASACALARTQPVAMSGTDLGRVWNRDWNETSQLQNLRCNVFCK